jgi:predicted GNAT superfamily acetyltransferase
VPADVDALRGEQPALARAWRSAFRGVFGAAFDDGLRVLGMTADSEYVLGR